MKQGIAETAQTHTDLKRGQPLHYQNDVEITTVGIDYWVSMKQPEVVKKIVDVVVAFLLLRFTFVQQ